MMNINRSDDPYYRYRMPKLQTKRENKGTVLLNLPEIARSLNRTEESLVKYFTLELGCSGRKDSQGHWIITSRSDNLQTLIFRYITDFIICPACDNPETTFIGKKTLILSCKACGTLAPVISRHQLVEYLLKNL